MLDYRINQSSPEAFFEYGKELLQTDSEKALGFFYRSFSGGFKEAKIFIDSIEGSFKDEFIRPSSSTSFQDLLEGVVSGKFSNSIEANYRVFKEAFSLKEKDVYENCVQNICASSENPENKTEILKGVYETLKTLNDGSEIRFLEMIRETGVSDFGSGELLDFYRKTPGKYTDLELACAEYRYKYLKVPEAVLDVAEMVHFQKKDLLALSMLSGVVEGEYSEDIKTRANRLRDRIKMVVSGEVDVDWLTTEELERELYYGDVSGVAEGWSSLIQRKRSLDKRILDGILQNWNKFDDIGKEECFYCVRNMADELGKKGRWKDEEFVDDIHDFIADFWSEKKGEWTYIPAGTWYYHDIASDEKNIWKDFDYDEEWHWLDEQSYNCRSTYIDLEYLELYWQGEYSYPRVEYKVRDLKYDINKGDFSESFKLRAKKVRGIRWKYINEDRKKALEDKKRQEELRQKKAEEERLREERIRAEKENAEKEKLKEYQEKCRKIEDEIEQIKKHLSCLNIKEASRILNDYPYCSISARNEINDKYREEVIALRKRLMYLTNASNIIKNGKIPTEPEKIARNYMNLLLEMCKFESGSDQENELVAKALCKGAAWAEKFYESHLMLKKAAELGNEYAIKKLKSPLYKMFGAEKKQKYLD